MLNSDTRPQTPTPSVKKSPLGLIIPFLALAILVVGLSAVVIATRRTLDDRSQADSCLEAPIDVEFRLNVTGQSAGSPWKSGDAIKPKVGDTLEINCFSKYGEALLTNGVITGKRDGQTITLPYSGGQTQVRNYRITQPGVYSFTCSNGASCTNKDGFTVSGTAASPQPSSTPATSPAPGNCANPAVSDLNKDCKSTIEDYDIFLRDFVKQQ